MDIRKTFFVIRVVKHWNRLPGEVVDAPSFEVALSNLVYWKVSLPMAEGLVWMTFEGPFQPKPFHDSMIL